MGFPLPDALDEFLAAKLAPLLNLRDRHPALAAISERMVGLSARRSLPRWRRPWSETGEPAHPADVTGDFRDVKVYGVKVKKK